MRWKLLLAFCSLAIPFLALEIAARQWLPSIAPVRVDESLYDNPLPLLTGHAGPGIAFENLPVGNRMPEAKRPNEVRIFVVGESSVAGSPLDVRASPPAMLADDLQARFPDRTISVVNMGRPGSVSANAFYYTRFISRYDPDFIVYYMGTNDAPEMMGEQCAPVKHPYIHALWRAAVRRSEALWVVRAFGVHLLWAATEHDRWYSDRRCPSRSFHLWTRILVAEARRAGATVIIATPVISAAVVFEPNTGGSRFREPRELDPQYRELLACALEDDCDLGPIMDTALAADRFSDVRDLGSDWCDQVTEVDADPATARRASLCRRWRSTTEVTALDIHEEYLAYRAVAWRHAAEEEGAEVIEFGELLRQASPGEILAEEYFADRVHLFPHGYLYLARLISARIEHVMTGESERVTAPPSPAEARQYEERTGVSGIDIAFEQLVWGWYLTGLPMLEYAQTAFPVESCADRDLCVDVEYARIAIGWLRSIVGLDPALPPELAPQLEAFDPVAVLEELRARKR